VSVISDLDHWPYPHKDWDIVEILLRYCWDIVEILLRYCWDIVEILLRYVEIGGSNGIPMVSTLSIGHSPQPHLRPSERWMSWSLKPPCRIVRRCNISCCMWTCLADWVKSDFQCIMVHDVQGFWEFIIGNYMYQMMFITLLIITITSSPWEFLTCTTGIHREIPKSFHCPCANCAPISVTETSSSVA